jgi:photosystem II stability/assembly factor-like uncharacterized protein
MPVVALPVRDFKLLSSATGWVSTGNQLLLTTDNGAHWKDISPPVPDLPDARENKFSGVFFLNANTGWLLYATDTNDTNAEGRPYGYNIHLASTTDGGASWTTMSQLPRLNPWADLTGGGDVAFSDQLHGWVDLGVMRGGVLFATSDGGHTWRRSGGGGLSMVAASDRDLWFSGGMDDKLFVSHDGAETVTEVDIPFPEGVSEDDYYPTYSLPQFTDRFHGSEKVLYSAGAEKSTVVLFATSDGGQTWKPDRSLTDLPEITAGSMIGSTVVGSEWIIPLASKQQPDGILRLHSGERVPLGSQRGGGDILACSASFSTPEVGWTNCSGSLSSTVDGGAHWTVITPRARGASSLPIR